MIFREAVVCLLDLVRYGVVCLSRIERPKIGAQYHDSEVDFFLISDCQKPKRCTRDHSESGVAVPVR